MGFANVLGATLGATLGAALGAALGARLALRHGDGVVRGVVLVALVAVALKVAWDWPGAG